MLRRLLQTMMLMVFAAASVAAAPHVPDEIKAPAAEKLLLQAHATGVQIYTCKAAAGGASKWELQGPQAELHDRTGVVIGQHFTGPTWKYKDGSEVTGKASAHVDSPDANSVPWLLLSATGHTGEGVFARVSSIQRINTRGGKPPAGAECTAANNGAESKSSYSADYYFYGPAK